MGLLMEGMLAIVQNKESKVETFWFLCLVCKRYQKHYSKKYLLTFKMRMI